MGFLSFLKKIGGGVKKVAPAVVTNPGFQIGLTFLGVPPGAIQVAIPIVQSLQAAKSRKFKKAYKQIAPILQNEYGIMKRSDINYVIETALAVIEGRVKIEEDK